MDLFIRSKARLRSKIAWTDCVLNGESASARVDALFSKEKKMVRFIVHEGFIFSAGTGIFLAPGFIVSHLANLYTSRRLFSTL